MKVSSDSITLLLSVLACRRSGERTRATYTMLVPRLSVNAMEQSIDSLVAQKSETELRVTIQYPSSWRPFSRPVNVVASGDNGAVQTFLRALSKFLKE